MTYHHIFVVNRKLGSFLENDAGAAAVEFALLLPVFLLLIFGTVSYGSVFATYNSVEQLAAEAARASVAGLTGSERDQLARAYVTQNIGVYPLLDPARAQVTTSSGTTTFQVDVSYDMSNSFVFKFRGIVPLPSSTVQRAAAIQFGGY
ncbi:MAG: pilus assembly protein TadE [Methylocystaceae bacterium]|nr:MAG: pilus assembly protein TadE [Methylocystaceae bacterium]